MPNGLVIGDDKRVVEWAYKAFHLFPVHVNRALGIVNPEGLLIGAIFLNNYNGRNVELSYYGARTCSIGIVRSIARLVLSEFNAARVTILTSKRNKRLVLSLQKFGWKVEGAQRCYYGHLDSHKNTAIRLVLFRDQIERIAAYPVSFSTQQQG